MKVRVLKPVAGYGTFVQGSPRLFSLLPGDLAEVEDGQARQWIAGGIVAPAEEAPMPDPETAMRPPAHNAALPRPKPRPQPRAKKETR